MHHNTGGRAMFYAREHAHRNIICHNYWRYFFFSQFIKRDISSPSVAGKFGVCVHFFLVCWVVESVAIQSRSQGEGEEGCTELAADA